MKTPQDVVIRPIVTEASMAGLANRKYTFKVAKDATKVDIAYAVEKLFGVQVEKVNTMNVRGRAKRMGMHQGYKPDWKKAIVTLKEGSKTIEFFENMM